MRRHLLDRTINVGQVKQPFQRAEFLGNPRNKKHPAMRNPDRKRDSRRSPIDSFFLLKSAVQAKGIESQAAPVGVEIGGGELTAIRSPFYQMPPLAQVGFERGVRITGRGSVDNTKRSQAFSIQSLGQNPGANCTSNRRIIKHTTYLS